MTIKFTDNIKTEFKNSAQDQAHYNINTLTYINICCFSEQKVILEGGNYIKNIEYTQEFKNIKSKLDAADNI